MEALWADIIHFVVGLATKMLSEVFDFTNFGEYFEIKIFYKSVQFISKMADFIVQYLDLG